MWTATVVRCSLVTPWWFWRRRVIIPLRDRLSCPLVCKATVLPRRQLALSGESKPPGRSLQISANRLRLHYPQSAKLQDTLGESRWTAEAGPIGSLHPASSRLQPPRGSHLLCLFLASWLVFLGHLIWRFSLRKKRRGGHQERTGGWAWAALVRLLGGSTPGQLRAESLWISPKLVIIKKTLLVPVPSCPWLRGLPTKFQTSRKGLEVVIRATGVHLEWILTLFVPVLCFIFLIKSSNL